MKTAFLHLFLKNIEVFCVVILLLFFTGIFLGIASHDANKSLFFGIYVGLVVSHLFVNIRLGRRLSGFSFLYQGATTSILVLLYVLLWIPFI